MGSALGSGVVAGSGAVNVPLVFDSEGLIDLGAQTVPRIVTSSVAFDTHGLVGIRCFKSFSHRETFTNFLSTGFDWVQLWVSIHKVWSGFCLGFRCNMSFRDHNISTNFGMTGCGRAQVW